MAYRIGVDVGGSFTDFAVLDDETGDLATLKVFSRPDAPGEEIVTALTRLQESGQVETGAVRRFTHGTTVGINTVIQRNGPKLALFTTANFEDVLELARLKIPEIHNLYSKRPVPLIPRECVMGIDERVLSDGSVQKAPERKDIERALQLARKNGAEGIVVAFLNAYRNSENEKTVAAVLKEIDPGLMVTTSSGTWPVIREYERTLTAVISGYVRSRVSHYLDRLEQSLKAQGVTVPALITKSNGGVMGLDQARAESVQMLLSGTASGVIGAGYIAQACEYADVLTLDIGGTSADVAVLQDGQAQHGTGELVGEFPIHIPSVAVSSVGQGGGSVAWIDPLGVLKVGPESAGSTPGPACYGRGGTKPTITDAMAVQNLIGHGDLGYGAVSVDHKAARAAIEPLAAQLQVSVEEVAASIVEIATSAMYAETQGLVSRFGIDLRGYHLIAFGGAGPMLACYLARELDVAGVLVPPTPGVVSALGGLVADLRNDFIKTLFLELTSQNVSTLVAPLDEMMAEGLRWLADQGFDGTPQITVSADMRYRGQSYEIETPLDRQAVENGEMAAIVQAFHREHERLFGHSDSSMPVQLINLRLVICGPTPKPRLPKPSMAASAPEPEEAVQAYFDGTSVDVPVYRRSSLAPGHKLAGPVIVAQDDTTTVVPPDFGLQVDSFGNLLLTRGS
ncbi:hydantoinase/oxoprolinase family protein [Roseibium sp. HPY-6]|uniref:hydantoinase/oxoprolinase family protein n=1 Tax=Roseibium sp. HPY-6 TaxID=3229852 RepID=UPI00338F7C2E